MRDNKKKHMHVQYHQHGKIKKEDIHVHLDDTTTQKIYIIDHLGCANCAAKMEKKIKELSEVEDATITFATKQLRVVAEHPERLMEKLQKICQSIESEVVLRPLEEQTVSKEEKKENQKTFVLILMAAVLFIIGNILKNTQQTGALIAFVTAYGMLGFKILKQAGKNMLKGQVFDENFLMSIATIAAFLIGDFAEAVGVMLFFRIGEWFEESAVTKSRSQIMEVVDLRPDTVQVLHGEHTHTISAVQAKVGDLLLVRPGDRIPLDGVVVKGESRINTAPVTGESLPVKVQPGSAVMSGCINTAGLIHICVEKRLEDSMVTRILNSVENAAASKPKIDRFITRFARVYTPVVVAIAVATAILPSLFTGEWEKWIYTAITFLVISCPCALVLSVPLAFFSGIGIGSKKRILFKGGLAMETLPRVKAVVFDKTGTLTQGNFAVQKCHPKQGSREEELLKAAAECELQSSHPIAQSIVEAAKQRGLHLQQPGEVKELAGKGICANVNGVETICGNLELMKLYGVKLPKQEETAAGTTVYLAQNGIYAGCIEISDTIKADANQAVASLKAKGIHTVMLTGDTEETAKKVAAATGVEEVCAKLLPEEKLEQLYQLRRKYGEIMFIGDGINDAPVLAGADVGAAMGNGADAAIEAADVVFMTTKMEAVPEAFAIAKQTNRIAVQNIVFALGVKGLVMLLGLLGFANMWMAVFADTGVAMLCVLNAVRILRRK